MSGEDAYELIGIVTETGIPEIDIIGGEPLLLPWITEFIFHATERGIKINISTNGSLPDVISRLSKIPSDLLDIGFSIHGSREIHESLTMSRNFSKAVTGITNLISAGKNPIVKSILMPENIDEICNLVSYLKDLGVKRYYLIYEDIIGRKNFLPYFSFPEFRDFYSKIKAAAGDALEVGFVAASGFFSNDKSCCRCSAGTEKFALLPDGSVFPCNLFAGFKEFYLGNIFENRVETIMRSEVLDFFIKHDCKNRCTKTECKYYMTCRGGCPAHSYYFYGSLNYADPRCMLGE